MMGPLRNAGAAHRQAMPGSHLRETLGIKYSSGQELARGDFDHMEFPAITWQPETHTVDSVLSHTFHEPKSYTGLCVLAR